MGILAALSLALLLPAVASGQIPAITYNGSPIAAPAMDRLYPVPGGVGPGLALAELFPPQLEAWRLTAGKRVLESDDLADRLGDMYLAREGSRWFLVSDPGPVSASAGAPTRERIAVDGLLALEGESCPEKSLEAWLSWEGVPQLKALIQRWALQAGVTVKTVDVPSIKSKLITVVRGGGKSPDLIMVQSDYLSDLYGAGALQELDGLALPAGLAKGRASFTLKGRLLAAPFYCDTQLVFYWNKLVPKAPEPDWTLADMESMARASGATAQAAWNAYSAYWFLPFVLGFGRQSIVDADGKLGLAEPSFAKALEWTKAATDRGFLMPMERDAMMSYFTSGKAAFILSGSYSLPEFRRLGLDFGVAPYPRMDASGKALPPLLDYKGWAIARTSKSPVLARRLIQYLSSPAVQAMFTQTQGKLPANEEAWALIPPSEPYQAVLRASYQSGVALPAHPAYGEFKNAIWKLLRLYLDGSMTRDALVSAARTMLNE